MYCVGRGDLIVGVDLIVLARPVEVALGGVDAGLGQRRAHVLHVQAVGGQFDGIDLNADRGLLAAADAHQSHAGQLRKLRRQARIDHVLDLRQRHAVGTDGQREDGRIGGIGLVVDRGYRQIGRQKCLAAIDRRLHFFFGHVERERKAELKHDDRHAAGAGRSHLAQPLHLAELAFQRRRYGGRHHIRAGAGIEGEHLDRRVIDLRQRGNRQLRESDDAHQQNCGHQQRSCDRPQNEWAETDSWSALGGVGGCGRIVTLERKIGDPLISFWKLLLATTSPGLMPVTAVLPLIRDARLHGFHHGLIALE